MPHESAPPQGERAASHMDSQRKLTRYLRAFLVPMLVSKSFILYFGLKYSEYPGDGYGYGLIAAIVVTLANFGLFLYKSAQAGEMD